MKIAIRMGNWTALNTRSRMGAKYAPFLVALGEPAIWVEKTDPTEEWAVFSDRRIKPEDVAYVAAIIQQPAIVNFDLTMPSTKEEALDNHEQARANRPAGVDLTSWLPGPEDDEVDLTAVISAQGVAVRQRMKAGADVDNDLQPLPTVDEDGS